MRKKTLKLNLFDRTEEIYNELPKEYRDIIFNNLISKSLLDNSFSQELSLYLGNEETEEILKKLKVSFKKTNYKKREIKDKVYINEVKKGEKDISDNEDAFSF